MNADVKSWSSARDRLSVMPAVFTTSMFINEQCYSSRKYADAALSRLCAAGHLERCGEGIYYNLIADPTGPQTREMEALTLALRRPAILVGGNALKLGGWTTQLWQLADIAVPATRTTRSAPRRIGRHHISVRPMQWFNVLWQAGIDAHGYERGMMVTLAPSAYALADMLLAPRLLPPSLQSADRLPSIVPSDEIDMGDRTSEDCEQVREAMLALGASPELAEELLDPYLDCFDGDGCTVIL